MENCPICGRPLKRQSETNRYNWFWGNYDCMQCGRLRIGGLLRNGRYTPDHIHPECTLHGLDPVTFVVPNEQWVCLVKGCNRVMRLVDGRIEVRQLRNPAPISTESFALECSGGLG